MKAAILQFRNQTVCFLREPAAAIFNLLLPFIIVLIQAVSFGDSFIGDSLPGYRVVDALAVNAGVMFALIVGLFGMGIGLSSMIEARSLAGFSLRPGGVKVILGSYGLVMLTMVIVGWVASTVALWFGWHILAPTSPGIALLVMILGVAVFISAGACIAGIAGNPRSAQGICSALFFPLLFLSGAVFPIDTFPNQLQVVAKWLPGYRFSELLAPTWVAYQDFDFVSLVYMLVSLLVLTFTAQLLLSGREDV